MERNQKYREKGRKEIKIETDMTHTLTQRERHARHKEKGGK